MYLLRTLLALLLLAHGCHKSDSWVLMCDMTTYTSAVVPLYLVCDGVPDCPNSYDELNPTRCRCPRKKFVCSKGECVSPQSLCDGKEDCFNAGDEHPWTCRSRDDKTPVNEGTVHMWQNENKRCNCAGNIACSSTTGRCPNKVLCAKGSVGPSCQGGDALLYVKSQSPRNGRITLVSPPGFSEDFWVPEVLTDLSHKTCLRQYRARASFTKMTITMGRDLVYHWTHLVWKNRIAMKRKFWFSRDGTKVDYSRNVLFSAAITTSRRGVLIIAKKGYSRFRYDKIELMIRPDQLCTVHVSMGLNQAFRMNTWIQTSMSSIAHLGLTPVDGIKTGGQCLTVVTREGSPTWGVVFDTHIHINSVKLILACPPGCTRSLFNISFAQYQFSSGIINNIALSIPCVNGAYWLKDNELPSTQTLFKVVKIFFLNCVSICEVEVFGVQNTIPKQDQYPYLELRDNKPTLALQPVMIASLMILCLALVGLLATVGFYLVQKHRKKRHEDG